MDTEFTLKKSKHKFKKFNKSEELEIHDFTLSLYIKNNKNELDKTDKLSIKEISSIGAFILSVVEFVYRIFCNK